MFLPQGHALLKKGRGRFNVPRPAHSHDLPAGAFRLFHVLQHMGGIHVVKCAGPERQQGGFRDDQLRGLWNEQGVASPFTSFVDVHFQQMSDALEGIISRPDLQDAPGKIRASQQWQLFHARSLRNTG